MRPPALPAAPPAYNRQHIDTLTRILTQYLTVLSLQSTDTYEVTTIVNNVVGASVDYTRATPVPATLGGVTAGDTFSGTVQDALDLLLYPYQYPAFSSFSFGQASPLEVGDSILSGVKTFTWSTTNSANITGTMEIQDVTASTTILTALANDGIETYTFPLNITKTSATSHTWRISGTNSHAGSFTRDVSVAWQWRTCFGESTSTSLDSAAILALRVTALSASFSGNKAFVGGGYKFICYPTTFGLKTTFKDVATNLDVAMVAASTVSVTNAFGVAQDYYVHRTLNILGGAITIAVS